MFVPWEILNRRHPTTDLCARGAERKLQWMAKEEAREGDALVSKAYGHPLTMVSYF